MRFDLDTYKEILDTITRNKSRSLLTGFGVFWGVFMLIALMGGGQGLKELLQNNFAGFATNTAIVFAQKTTKPYKGFNKGRSWQMETNDLQRLRQQIPELDVITPLLFGGRKTVVFSDKTFSGSTQGVNPDYADVSAPKMFYGRYINDIDVRQQRKVCVIGKQIYKNLFPGGGDPCGKSVRVDSTYYTVVGVDYRSGNGVNFGGRADETITLPQSVLRTAYNRGNAVDIIAVTGKPGIVMSTLADRICRVIARPHSIDPADEKGLMVFNTEVLFQMLDNLFNGVNFLIWFRHRHPVGRSYRCEQHHDGNGKGTHHRDRNPACHRRHSQDDTVTNHLGEYYPDPCSRYEWHYLRCGNPAADRIGQYHRRYFGCPLPGQLLDGHLLCPAHQSPWRFGRTGTRLASHEYQTRRCYA